MPSLGIEKYNKVPILKSQLTCVLCLCTMQVSKTAVINPIVQFKAPTAQRIKKEKIKFKFSRLWSSHGESLPDLYSFWTWRSWHSLWWLAFKWLNIRNYLSQNTWIFLFLQVMKVIPTELGKTSVAFLPSGAMDSLEHLPRLGMWLSGRTQA